MQAQPKPYPMAEEKIRTNPDCGCSPRRNPVELTREVPFDIMIGAARALFVTAWADDQEERGASFSQMELMDVAPETDNAAENAAKKLIDEIETLNKKKIGELFIDALRADGWTDEEIDNGEYPAAERKLFGHYLAMESLGHGVSWFDDHEKFPLKFPHIEFHASEFSKEYPLFNFRPQFSPGSRPNPARKNPAPGAIPFTTKKGETRYRLTISEGEYHAEAGNDAGFCIRCGEYQYGCEPDMRRGECENCGELGVYGLEELLMMGWLTFGPDRENPRMVVKGRKPTRRPSKRAREFISKEISHLVKEKGMSQRQAIRVAHEVARRKGMRVPGIRKNPDEGDTEPMEEFCPACDQLNAPMGILGNLAHYRCRACGMMYSRSLKPKRAAGKPTTKKEKLPRRKNPAQSAAVVADGTPVVTEVSALGRCVSLKYFDEGTGKIYTVNFPGAGPREIILAQTARKRLCFFYAPKLVNATPESFDQAHLKNYKEFNGKDVGKIYSGFVPVLYRGSKRAGELREIVYWSDKIIDPESALAPANYHHTFKAPYPVLSINPENQLVVDGGGYHINRRGIIN